MIYSGAVSSSKLLGESPTCLCVLGQDPNRDFEFDKPTSVTFFFSFLLSSKSECLTVKRVTVLM